jgi:hypothetical protein
MTSERRTWDTPIRQPWNAPIHHCLRAIDNHTALCLHTRLPWHLEKAAALRAYVHELKTYIHVRPVVAAALQQGGCGRLLEAAG